MSQQPSNETVSTDDQTRAGPSGQQGPSGQLAQEGMQQEVSEQEHVTDDPLPPPEGAAQSVRRPFYSELNQYARKMREEFLKHERIRGPVLFDDFRNSFSVEGLKSLSRPNQVAWRELLTERGIVVPEGRGVERAHALISVLLSERCEDVSAPMYEPRYDYDGREDKTTEPNIDDGGDEMENEGGEVLQDLQLITLQEKDTGVRQATRPR
jgi:hypothetical protein